MFLDARKIALQTQYFNLNCVLTVAEGGREWSGFGDYQYSNLLPQATLWSLTASALKNNNEVNLEHPDVSREPLPSLAWERFIFIVINR